MEVCIYAEKYKNDIWYKGCTLQLPVHQKALEDARQRARVADGEGYMLEITGEWPVFLYEPLEPCSATLEELNHLALKLSQMNVEEQGAYEGVVQSLQEKSIKNLINGTYNVSHFEFLPGIMDEEELGEVSIENDLVPIIRDLPEEVYRLLSPERVGNYVKEQEHGVFTSRGYCYRSSEEWMEPYDGVELPEQVEEGSIFSLHLWSPEANKDDWLELPSSTKNAMQVLGQMGILTFQGCTVTEIHSPITQFEDSLDKKIDVDEMNQLAEELASLSPKELVKYKAIAAYESCGSLEHARKLYHTMDRYTFDPIQVSLAAYGRECLREGEADLEAEAFRNFDFESYGKVQFARSGMHMTPYGAISYEPPLEELPENRSDMEEQKSEEISDCGMQMGI